LSGAAAEAALRRGFETGDYGELAALYADDALLDASVQGARETAAGPDAAVEVLGRRWSGQAELVEWAPSLFPDGMGLWMERVAEARASRTRQYLRFEGERITRHWIYGGTPRTQRDGGGGGLRLDPALLAGLGPLVEHQPLVSRGWSGNELERVLLADGRRLIAKRIVPGRNWLERLTDDWGREALLFRDGVLDRMPAAVDHTIVGAEEDGEGGWWVFMRDVSDAVFADDHRITREQHRRVLGAANLMWEEYWGETVPHTCSLGRTLGVASRVSAEAERDAPDLLPHQFEAFWDGFEAAVPPDVAGPVLRLLEDPAPLVRALDARGTTLIHGDLRDEQLGIADDRVVMLDWGIATQGHPVVDLCWYMAHDVWRTDATHDEFVEDFRRARGESDDPEAVELGMICGLVRYGWIFGHSAAFHPDPAEREWARGELDWWVPRARLALERTGLG
jgi:hypothetical protein